MVHLTFYGGVNEIGGNKILLEDGDARVFLDFGMSFGQANNYFSEFLQPRKCNGLGDFFEFGLIPDLKGLYRSDFLKHMVETRSRWVLMASSYHMPTPTTRRTLAISAKTCRSIARRKATIYLRR